MTIRSTSIVFTIVAVLASVQSASAQSAAQDLQRLRQQFSQPAQTTYPVTPVQPVQQVSPVYPQPVYPGVQYPQYPVYVSPDQYNGINPWTGGIDTKNEQVDNTYYDPYREASKLNGTRRWVRRPIYDQSGQITGYQEGWVWTNSVTGVEHGELKNVTENQHGGEHEQIQIKSVPAP